MGLIFFIRSWRGAVFRICDQNIADNAPAFKLLPSDVCAVSGPSLFLAQFFPVNRLGKYNRLEGERQGRRPDLAKEMFRDIEHHAQ